MAAMANFNLHQAHSRNLVAFRRPNPDWRRTESNLEYDFSDNIFGMRPSRVLRRIASTLDLSSPGFHSIGSNTMLQLAPEGGYANDKFIHNLYPKNSHTKDNYLGSPYHSAASCLCSTDNSNFMDHDHAINTNNGAHSKQAPLPAPSVFFDVHPQRAGYRMPRDSVQQPPISRPAPKIGLCNSDPTATTSADNDVKFPATANLTDGLMGIYTAELKKRPQELRREKTEPVPRVITQPKWPTLRRPYVPFKTKGHNIEKSFENSLFSGGLDAFIHTNAQNQAQYDTINATGNGIQLSLSSPTPIISGKQLIEKLQRYEDNVARIKEPSHLSNGYSSQCYLELGGPQKNFPVPSDQRTGQQITHDNDGRKKKGFKRGDSALQVALAEEWAVVRSVLNASTEIVPNSVHYYVIKSNCELDVFASLKHGIWTSTDLGNQRLDKAFRDPYRKSPIYLFFSVSGSGKFCGVAEMTSSVDLAAHAGCWSDKRWRGRFSVQWKIVKDVFNSDLRHFRVPNNENKPFTNCRDTQEILPDVGDQILFLFARQNTSSSLLQNANPAPRYAVSEEHFVNQVARY